MMRNVYLQGELGHRFGSVFKVNADSYQDIFKCINANRPEFLGFVRQSHLDDIGFIVEQAGKGVEDEDDLLNPLKEGDVTIAIAPAGSKSGLGKILAAIAIVALIVVTGGAAGLGLATTTAGGTALATSAGWAVVAGGGLSIPGMFAAMGVLNLAMMGISQMMAPDPSVDSDAPENYAFNGNAQNVKEGDPIAVLYGRLRVPGRPISINVSNESYYKNYSGSIQSGDGSLQTTTTGTSTAININNINLGSIGK